MSRTFWVLVGATMLGIALGNDAGWLACLAAGVVIGYVSPRLELWIKSSGE